MNALCVAGVVFALLLNSSPQKRATDVFVMDGDNRIQMKYSLADIKGSHNVLGAKEYHTLNSPKSDLRIKTNIPQFLLYSDPAEKLNDVLIRFDVKSDHREIRFIKVTTVGSTSSLPRDHVVDVKIEEVSSEPGNRRMNLYRVTPTSPLLPGEYCIVLHRVFYFDFGIDAKPKS